MAKKLYINTNATSPANGAVAGGTDFTPLTSLTLTAGDNPSFQLQFFSAVGTELDITGGSIKCTIGDLNARPTSGTFTISSTSDTTTALTFDETITDVQTALNALESSAGPEGGTVVVTGSTGSPFFIKWDANGSRLPLTVDAASLTPPTTATITEVTAGDGSTREVQMIRLTRDPLVEQTSWTITSGTNIATATVDLNTSGIYRELGIASSFDTTLEIQYTDASSNVQTVVQLPLTIKGEGTL